MAYVKNYGGDWKNWPDTTTPITEAALDNLETQYDEAVADIDPATKEFFVTFGYTNDTFTQKGQFSVAHLTVGGKHVYFSFKCPHDFTSLTSCLVVGIPNVNGTLDWTVNTDFGAHGAAYNASSDTDTQNGLACTASQLNAIEVKLALTGLVADEYIGLQFVTDVLTGIGSFDVIGLVFKYS